MIAIKASKPVVLNTVKTQPFQMAPICYLVGMSTVQEIEAAIPRLSRSELQELREWFETYLEEHLELTDEVKASLDQSRREIAEGNFMTA